MPSPGASTKSEDLNAAHLAMPGFRVYLRGRDPSASGEIVSPLGNSASVGVRGVPAGVGVGIVPVLFCFVGGGSEKGIRVLAIGKALGQEGQILRKEIAPRIPGIAAPVSFFMSGAADVV